MKKFLVLACAAFILSACNPEELKNIMDEPQPAPAAETTEIQDIPPATKDVEAGYQEYSPATFATAAKKGRVVLFFRAKWCPTCKVADEDIRSNLHQIPNDLTILDVDYDTADELKKKHAITYQHTFVQVDSQGNEITKWNGGELNEILQNIQ